MEKIPTLKEMYKLFWENTKRDFWRFLDKVYYKYFDCDQDQDETHCENICVFTTSLGIAYMAYHLFA